MSNKEYEGVQSGVTTPPISHIIHGVNGQVAGLERKIRYGTSFFLIAEDIARHNRNAQLKTLFEPNREALYKILNPLHFNLDEMPDYDLDKHGSSLYDIVKFMVANSGDDELIRSFNLYEDVIRKLLVSFIIK